MIPFQTKINAMYRGESGWNVKKEKSKKGQRERERERGGDMEREITEPCATETEKLIE